MRPARSSISGRHSSTSLRAVGGLGGLPVLAGFVVAVFLLAFLAFLLVGLAAAVFAHVEAIEEVVYHVAEPALIVEHALEAVEIAAGALFDQRAPQLDHLARGRRRRLAG